MKKIEITITIIQMGETSNISITGNEASNIERLGAIEMGKAELLRVIELWRHPAKKAKTKK